MEETGKRNDAATGLDALSRIDMALLGLAQLRAQAGAYEYVQAAKLCTALSATILSPTLLPVTIIPMAPVVSQPLNRLIHGLQHVGVV